jgi:hypothetical protein
VLARCLGPFVDAKLATGQSPDAGVLRAVRARALVGAAHRRRLVRDWENLLERAHGRSVLGGARVPIRRDRIVAAERDIHEMLRLLGASVPVPVRGVAMASLLLTDGTGPIYNRRHPVDVGDAVREATRHLDPSTGLMTRAESREG